MTLSCPAQGEHLISELKLDPAEQAAVKQLMVERRTELLTLIDKSPPPTLRRRRFHALSPKKRLRYSRFKPELAPSRFTPARRGRRKGILRFLAPEIVEEIDGAGASPPPRLLPSSAENAPNLKTRWRSKGDSNPRCHKGLPRRNSARGWRRIRPE
jgi:hypothetical protein